MKICPNCGNKLLDKAKVCPFCKTNVKKVSVTNSYERVSPASSGPAVMPKPKANLDKPKKPLYKRWWFWLIVVIVAGSALGGGGSDSDKKSGDSKEAAKTEAEAPKLSPEEQFAKDNDIDAKLATDILTACEATGMKTNDISGFALADDWANGKRYSFNYSDYSFLVYMNQDGTINGINSGQVKFYENGAAVINVNDKLISSEQRSWLITAAQMDVENSLKSPKSAGFPGAVLDADKWSISRDGTTFTVTSYVDAQNSFGAMIRSNFQVTYEWDGTLENAPIPTNIVIE